MNKQSLSDYEFVSECNKLLGTTTDELKIVSPGNGTELTIESISGQFFSVEVIGDGMLAYPIKYLKRVTVRSKNGQVAIFDRNGENWTAV